MSTLFTVRQSWFNQPALYEQLAYASEGDSLLLIQDAVLALRSPISLASFLAKCNVHGVKVFSLRDDIDLRGIENQYESVVEVDYAGFVNLVVEHDKHVAW